MISLDSPSLTSINDFSEDILAEIICRLDSIKHVLSCMSVSKSWHNLITTICIPKIASSSSPVDGILFNTCPLAPLGDKGPWSYASLDASNQILNTLRFCAGSHFPFPPRFSTLFDCSNGLLLFFNYTFKRFYIVNPSTMQYLIVPQLSDKTFYGIAALSFECPENYRVVQISHCSPSVTMSIFYSKTQEWSVYNIDMDSSPKYSIWSDRCVCLSDSLYGLSLAGFLLKFDTNQIGFRAIDLPIKFGEYSDTGGCLGISQGILHYAWDDKISKLMVWTFNGSGNTDEWVLKNTICLQYFYTHYERWSSYSVFAFHPTTSNILLVGNRSGVWLYHIDTKKMETICTLRENKMVFWGQHHVFLFSVNLTTLGTSSHNIKLWGRIHKIDDDFSDDCMSKQDPLASTEIPCDCWEVASHSRTYLPLPDTTFLDIDNTIIQLPASSTDNSTISCDHEPRCKYVACHQHITSLDNSIAEACNYDFECDT